MDIENDYRKITICLIAIIAIVILIFNTYFNAKYKTRVSGSDIAHVAKWNVGIDTSNNADKLYLVSENENDTNSYNITVTSTSEVSSRYSIILSNVPDGLQVKLDSGDYRSPDGNIITFDYAGTFLIGEQTTRTHTLTFKDLLTSNNNGDIDVDVNVVFEQID